MRGLSTKLQSLCWSSTSKTLHFRLSNFHKIDNFATLAKPSKPNKARLKQQQSAYIVCVKRLKMADEANRADADQLLESKRKDSLISVQRSFLLHVIAIPRYHLACNPDQVCFVLSVYGIQYDSGFNLQICNTTVGGTKYVHTVFDN